MVHLEREFETANMSSNESKSRDLQHHTNSSQRSVAPRFDEAAFEKLDHQDSPTSSTTPQSTASHGESNGSAVEAKHHFEAITTNDNTGRPVGRPWTTTLIRFGPLSGIACMMLAILSMMVSLGILVGSRRQPTRNWAVPPSTYLAICTAVANQAMRFAAFQGIAIAWWYRATYGTSTLARLHYDWRAGTTVLGAVTAGRNMGFLGLASIFSTLVAIDGPFLQKATTIVPAEITDHPIPLNVTIAPELPTDWSGKWFEMPGHGFNSWRSGMFNETIPTSYGNTSNHMFAAGRPELTEDWNLPWFRGETLSGLVQGCEDRCSVKIQAPALTATHCASQNVSLDFYAPMDPRTMINRAIPLSHDVFIVDMSLIADQKERLNLITGYADVHACKGTLNLTACTLEAALGEYDVIVDGGKISAEALGMPRIIALVNNTEVNHSDIPGLGHPSTLAGVAQAFLYKWSTSLALIPVGEDSQQWIAGTAVQSYMYYPRNEFCPSTLDPWEDAMKSLNSLMFYGGVAAVRQDWAHWGKNVTWKPHMDPGLEFHTPVTGYIKGTQSIYHTNLSWFLAAAIVEGVCIALILPTYMGWWRLGRAVSMSPLETAKVS